MRDSWRATTIGEIAEVVGGGTPKTSVVECWDGNIPWITPTEVTAQEGRTVTATARTISAAGLAASSARLLPVGAVLLTSRATIGATAIVGVAMATNQGFASLIAGPEVLPRFLMYWCQHNRNEFASRAGGSTFPEISKTSVRAISLELPPIPTQRRISDLISAFDQAQDELSDAAHAAVTAASAIRRAAFEAPDLEAIPLSALCGADGIQIGPFGSQLHARDYVDDGVPTVMPKDIVDGRIDTSTIARVAQTDWERLSKHHLREGDIVLPRRGDLKKRALVGADEAGWICGTGSIRVRVANEDARVVFEALSTAAAEEWLSANAVGITMPNLNTAIVSRIPVRLPVGAQTVVTVLDALGAYRAACVAAGLRIRVARDVVLSTLLSGEDEIPDSYDALLEGVS